MSFQILLSLLDVISMLKDISLYTNTLQEFFLDVVIYHTKQKYIKVCCFQEIFNDKTLFCLLQLNLEVHTSPTSISVPILIGTVPLKNSLFTSWVFKRK